MFLSDTHPKPVSDINNLGQFFGGKFSIGTSRSTSRKTVHCSRTRNDVPPLGVLTRAVGPKVKSVNRESPFYGILVCETPEFLLPQETTTGADPPRRPTLDTRHIPSGGPRDESGTRPSPERAGSTQLYRKPYSVMVGR